MALGFRDGGIEGVGLLPARAALGVSMVYHGVGKLKGGGPKETGHYFEALGIRPGKAWAVATGITEVGAGLLSLTGVGTRLAALGVLVTQGMAISKVHGEKGYSSMQGGFEYNLALVAIALGLLLSGPGRISGHTLLEKRYARRSPLPWKRARRSLALALIQ